MPRGAAGSGFARETDSHEELDALSADIRDRFVRIARLLEEFGPQQVRAPYVKPLVGKPWEMRMKGKDGIARATISRPAGSRPAGAG